MSSEESQTALAYTNRGVIRLALRDARGALEDLTQALRLNPNSAEAYLFRGRARVQLEDRVGALEDLRSAAESFIRHAGAQQCPVEHGVQVHWRSCHEKV